MWCGVYVVRLPIRWLSRVPALPQEELGGWAGQIDVIPSDRPIYPALLVGVSMQASLNLTGTYKHIVYTLRDPNTGRLTHTHTHTHTQSNEEAWLGLAWISASMEACVAQEPP